MGGTRPLDGFSDSSLFSIGGLHNYKQFRTQPNSRPRAAALLFRSVYSRESGRLCPLRVDYPQYYPLKTAKNLFSPVPIEQTRPEAGFHLLVQMI
jgi:hypothetical protein